MSIIEVRNLSKQYRIGTKMPYKTLRETLMKAITSPTRIFCSHKSEDNTIWALKDVSFEVNEGERVGIIGRNGAGKTTLLKILSRITEPTEGEVRIRGRVASLLEVGTGFHPELTGRENIYLNGAILGMTRAEINKKFDEIVAFAEIEKFIDTPVKRYSSGMYVRLAFAVAAHLEPEILLVDEVLAVGDAQFQKKCLGKMEDVSKEGRTILFVSHQMEAVSKICNRGILLHNGFIRHEGMTATVIVKYLELNESASKADLRERNDRIGEGRFKFIDTWIENDCGARVQSVQVGKDLRIVVEYEISLGTSINNLEIAIAINTIRNVSVTDLSNSFTGYCFPDNIPICGKIICTIPRLPINRGIYTYNLQALAGNKKIEDYVRNAGTFYVESGDFFGTGRIPDAERLILMEHRWDIAAE